VALALCTTCLGTLEFSLIVAASAHQLYLEVTAAKAFCDFVIKSLFTIGCLPRRHLCFDAEHALIIVLDICFVPTQSQSMSVGVVHYIDSSFD
jgi:hypothetical protein